MEFARALEVTRVGFPIPVIGAAARRRVTCTYQVVCNNRSNGAFRKLYYPDPPTRRIVQSHRV